MGLREIERDRTSNKNRDRDKEGGEISWYYKVQVDDINSISYGFKRYWGKNISSITNNYCLSNGNGSTPLGYSSSALLNA